jgi:hypothetical protein
LGAPETVLYHRLNIGKSFIDEIGRGIRDDAIVSAIIVPAQTWEGMCRGGSGKGTTTGIPQKAPAGRLPGLFLSQAPYD